MRQYIQEKILPHVLKPTRYLGNEWNVVKKEWEEAKVTMAFAFPDVYEIGMSHLGLHILYGLVNNRSEFLMERVFAPWVDMEEQLRRHKIPLFTLESYRALGDFHVLGFTLQYEMSYTNILNMLDLAGIPLKSADRQEGPLVIGGGPCALNPEPLAPFFDCFLLGDSEEMLLQLLEITARHLNEDGKFDREALLGELSLVSGIYVPGFYQLRYKPDGTIGSVDPAKEEVPPRVQRRIVQNLDEAYFPTKPLVPYMEIVHDRMMLEVMRGCTRGCRFCQAGMVYRPVRERKKDTLLKQAEELVQNTGHEEISLTSLSTADYSCVQPLTKELLNRYQDGGINVALPSLRVDAFSVDLAAEIQRVRKSGLTFAPEAGSQRMRNVINKNVTEEDLLGAVTAAFRAGWTNIKLYFMLGLPGETNDDLAAIADLAKKVLDIGRQELMAQRGRPNITVSVSSFVPKGHTPFQFEGQNPVEELRAKQQFLRGQLKGRGLKFKWHEAKLSFLEAVFARGGRKLAPVLENAWKSGCRFDSWDEHFDYAKWQTAFENAAIDPEFYANRPFDYQEVLPWDHLDAGVSKAYLIREHKRAMEEALTHDCRWDECTGCSICDRFQVENRLWGDEINVD
ncbi:TIGR03960 family B12-binding radical SAM protein [Metallumcola ferriviriculae]|uniref:TIGR03960 family B12-binding radical SAM protein n=1 Tax=Metallumcola ferriviriculae TaxID=3039180 RepID=A0AAU0ULR8_9FIRM|nr:TIGR03960 family B12-binding radical SAM protein [Desulfitibacteraceae bacterium MK1]